MKTDTNNSSILLSGMGRSGTTWVGDLINYDKKFRVLFEPFFPGRVKEASDFKRIQYLSPNSEDRNLAEKARKILTGKLRNNWVDRESDLIHKNHILIKDIRSNLMLGWLKRVLPELKIIVLVRHPLQVVYSWSRMGWGKGQPGKPRGIDIILSQDSLLQDFPMVNKLLNLVNLEDYVESIVFQWCLFTLIPGRQLQESESHVLYYENLILDPDKTLEGLFKYLKRPSDKKNILKEFSKSSHTNFLSRDHKEDKEILLNGWRREFTSKQISKTCAILEAFGLNDLYDNDGIPTGSQFFNC